MNCPERVYHAGRAPGFSARAAALARERTLESRRRGSRVLALAG